MTWSEKWIPRFLRVLPLAGVVLLGVVVMAAVLYANAAKTVRGQVEQDFTQQAESVAARISDWAAGCTGELRGYSANQTLAAAALGGLEQKAEIAAADTYLKVIKKNIKAYRFIALLDKNGQVLATSKDRYTKDLDLSGNTYFQEALKGRPVNSAVFASGKKTLFYILQPVYKERKASGKADQTPENVAGILACAVDVKQIYNRFVKPLKMGETGEAYIAEKSGLVIAHPDKKQVLVLNISDHEYGSMLMEKEGGMVSYEREDRKKQQECQAKLAAVQTIEKFQWLVVVEMPVKKLLTPVRKAKAVVVVVSVLLGLFLFFAMWYIFDSRAAIEALMAIHKSMIFSEKVALIVLLFTMIFMQFGQVIARNIFQTGFMWVDEVLRIEVLWVAFLGAGLAAEYNRHIKIDVLSHILGGGRASKTLDTLAQLFAFVVCLLLFHAAYQYILFEARFPACNLVENIPDYVFRMVIPYFFMVMSIRCLINIRRIYLGTHTRSIEP